MAAICKQIIIKNNVLKLNYFTGCLEKISCRTYRRRKLVVIEEDPAKVLQDKINAENDKKMLQFLKDNPVPNFVKNTEIEFFDALKEIDRKVYEVLPEYTALFRKDHIIDDNSEILLQAESKNRMTLREENSYREDRVEVLGHDLAAAHFFVYRGGAVKFVGMDIWFVLGKLGQSPLPNTFVKNLFVEAIDLSNSELLTYSAAEHLAPLTHLRYIRMHNCRFIDDTFLAQLYPLKNSLEFLDINNCPEITDNGLSCLYQLSNLQCLKVANLSNVKYLGLMCLLLEEKIPDLIVLGLNDDQLMPKSPQPLGERRLVRALLGFTNRDEEDFSKGSLREYFMSKSDYYKEMYGLVREVD